jgi:hypothetical protein
MSEAERNEQAQQYLARCGGKFGMRSVPSTPPVKETNNNLRIGEAVSGDSVDGGRTIWLKNEHGAIIGMREIKGHCV